VDTMGISEEEAARQIRKECTGKCDCDAADYTRKKVRAIISVEVAKASA